MLFRIRVSWRHTRPETSIFQWIVFEGYLQYSNPKIDCVDFELLYNALLQIAEYDSPEFAPFVETWDPFIKTNVTPERLWNIRLHMRRTLEELAMLRDDKKVEYLTPILTLLKKQPRLVVATLNYDNAVELLARDNSVPCDTGIKDWIEKDMFDFSGDGLKLLKLHGSVYWRWTEPITTYDLKMEHREIRYIEHYTDRFSTMVAVETPMVIYGQRNKLTTEGIFLDLLRQFDKELSNSDLLTVIGYSFRDEHINFFITKFLNSDESNVIRVVMPDFQTSTVEFVDRLRSFKDRRASQIVIEDKFDLNTFTTNALNKLYAV
ncbi:MAG: SIR2 family protein [Acidobacteria bacterium]|nr:SIR2 family protein [Acidobacteriota bacterium]